MLAHDEQAVSSSDSEIATKNTPSGGASILEARPATIDTDPDWQPVITAQVRANAATPVYLALTVAFKDCLTPNAAHAPPLVHATCTPPEQVSDDLIVGEPLVNGKAARFNGSVGLRTVGGNDLQLTSSMNDVRCARYLTGNCTGGPLSDFTGNLSLRYEAYVVDRMATLAPPVPPGSRAGSSSLLGFDFPIPCASTVDPNVGSTCSLTTSINTVFPGGIVATRRSSWTLGSVVVKDAPGGKVFATPGNFIP